MWWGALGRHLFPEMGPLNWATLQTLQTANCLSYTAQRIRSFRMFSSSGRNAVAREPRSSRCAVDDRASMASIPVSLRSALLGCTAYLATDAHIGCAVTSLRMAVWASKSGCTNSSPTRPSVSTTTCVVWLLWSYTPARTSFRAACRLLCSSSRRLAACESLATASVSLETEAPSATRAAASAYVSLANNHQPVVCVSIRILFAPVPTPTHPTHPPPCGSQ